MKKSCAILFATAALVVLASPAQAGYAPPPPPPEIPTPALLPGLIGLGLGILKKSQKD
jgi:hypothetical protein